MQYLLERGAELDARDSNGRTALMYASSGPFEPAVELLLEKGAAVNAQGTLEGFIAEATIGENGFGYDPIFFLPQLNKTVAQLTSDEKNAISHRANAIRRLKPALDKLF